MFSIGKSIAPRLTAPSVKVDKKERKVIEDSTGEVQKNQPEA